APGALWSGLVWPLVVVCIGCGEGPVNPALPSQAPNCAPGQHAYLDSCLANVVNNPPLPQPVTLALSCTVGAHLTPTSCNASATDERGTLVTAQLSGNVTWDFGDGSLQANGAVQMQHVYQQPGTFTVLVSAEGGRTGSTAKTLTVP